jgi:Oxidoreductase molybdopterin binding domain
MSLDERNELPEAFSTPETPSRESMAPEAPAEAAPSPEPLPLQAHNNSDVDESLPVIGMSPQSFRWRSRRDFLALGLGAAGLAAIWRWVLHGRQIGDLPWQLRRALDWNADVSQALLGTSRLARTFPVSDAVVDLRVNGDIGITPTLDPDKWRLQVIGLENPKRYRQFVEDVNSWDYGLTDGSEDAYPDNSSGAIPQASAPAVKQPGLLLTLDDLKNLPRAETVTQLKCIEGWSEIAYWGGARMPDFLAAYPPQRSRYISLQTPDATFYTSLDMATARHPQTLLAYEMNGRPLEPLHGAPLRLATPLKYGYKQLKQISRLEFTNQMPRDYWVENGYDWYGGH